MLKLLVKLNPETVEEDYTITFEGFEPKLCTGYQDPHRHSPNLIAIPIRELIKQGVSLHYEDLDWFDKGEVMFEDRPCKWFYLSEVTILCS